MPEMDYSTASPFNVREGAWIDEKIATIPKGDPGGLVKGTVIGATTDLDTLYGDGIYYNQFTSRPNALSLHYPHATNTAGTLTVKGWYRNGVDVIQSFVTAHVTAGSYRTMLYQRTAYNNVWSTWSAFAPTRVDETAGRAIYQWDDKNSREQLTYGDTGWRKVVNDNDIATHPNIQAYIHRVGQKVTFVTVEHTAGGSTTTPTTVYNVPLGFRANTGQSNPAMIFSGTIVDEAALVIPNTTIYSITAGANTIVLKPAAGKRHYAVLSYDTIDAWPTSLPGTAVGSVPNV